MKRRFGVAPRVGDGYREQFREFWTPQQVADLLQFHPMTVYRLMDRGELPHHRIGGSLRVRTKDLEAWLANKRA